MKQVNISQAKAQLSRLLKEAVAGEEIVIARDGVPMVKLVPVEPLPQSILGLVPDLWISEDFDEPMNDFTEYQ